MEELPCERAGDACCLSWVVKRGLWYYHLSHDEVTRDVSRRINCSLLVFIRQWGWLIRQYHLYHKGACDWCIQSCVWARSWFISTLMNNENLHYNIIALLTLSLQKGNKRNEKKMTEASAPVCLILATALTEGIQGEMPCLHPTKYHLGLQVREKKIQSYCVFWFRPIRYEILDKSIGYHL